MASPWLEAFPRTCKPFLEQLNETLDMDLVSIIESGPNAKLTATENAQPAIFAISIMILRVLEQDFGFKTAGRVDICLGHSLGEFAALVSSQHLRYEDALLMLRRRAEVVARCSKDAAREEGSEYGMIALVCEPDRLSSLIETIYDFLGHGASEGGRDDSTYDPPAIEQVRIANINSKNQIVLSGSIERIQALLVQLRQFGGHDPRAVRLATDSPFHSPIMLPAAKTVRDILEKTEITFPGLFPCVSNVSARPFGSANQIRELLSRQAVDTVRWWDSVRWLDQEEGVRRWIGIGPGKVGRNLVGKEVGMRGADRVKGGGVWGISGPKEVEVVLRELEETEGLG
jgi:[acyl-carrier-protein] S-malonyltransferase